MIQSWINQAAVIIVTLIDMVATLLYLLVAPLGLMGALDRIVAAVHSIVFAFARAASPCFKIIDGPIDAVLKLSPCYP